MGPAKKNKLISGEVDWINEFDKKFHIESNGEDEQFKLIIGISPYKQKVGNICLRVDAKTNYKEYSGFRQIAFLVNRWIKIQDSIEMIFNLLAGDCVRALQILSYLREHQISAVKFAEYLLERHGLMLVNRIGVEYEEKGISEQDQKKSIEDVISQKMQEGKHVSVLLVGGNNMSFKIDGFNGFKCGKVLHPSGANLSKSGMALKYYKTWYEFATDSISGKSNSKTIDWNVFHVLKARSTNWSNQLQFDQDQQEFF